MAHLTDWQKSLRRSTGEIKKPIIKPPAVRRRTDKLSSISEDVFDENVSKQVQRGARERRKLSTKGSVSDLEPVNNEVKSRAVTKSPVKRTKARSFLKPLPKCNLTIPQELEKDLPSPIPLPPGVTNIDDDEDSTLTYAKDIMNYVQNRDRRLRPDYSVIVDGSDTKLPTRRDKLVEWMVSVAHGFHCSQETLYHTIDIIDRCLCLSKFSVDHLQLLGIAAFLIATKLDEYYPADIKALCKLTEETAASSTIRAMEMHILELIQFQAYALEPMTFVRRFLKAAQRLKDLFVYELSILFMDAMVQNLELWKFDTDKKAAISVFSALIVTDHDGKTNLDEIWTPNLAYYAWSDPKELLSTTIVMLSTLQRILNDKDNEFSITAKYMSQSRHHGLLRNLSMRRVKNALLFAQTLESTDKTME